MRPAPPLITCEHGGNDVPAEYAELFRGREAMLQSHRGYDRGALRMARDFASHFEAPLLYATTTRLLVDLNRSPGHPRLFSEATRGLSRAGRQKILARHHRPYRSQVEHYIQGRIAAGPCVVHVSSHSFTPVMDGLVRNADVGLLYDPSRPGERALAQRWRRSIRSLDPDIRIRMNYPYTGKADGLITHLRRLFPADRYVGIELEVNQRYPQEGGSAWNHLRRILVESLDDALR
jgi:predicted N-formylglutamate amidohydrolase